MRQRDRSATFLGNLYFESYRTAVMSAMQGRSKKKKKKTGHSKKL